MQNLLLILLFLVTPLLSLPIPSAHPQFGALARFAARGLTKAFKQGKKLQRDPNGSADRMYNRMLTGAGAAASDPQSGRSYCVSCNMKYLEEQQKRRNAAVASGKAKPDDPNQTVNLGNGKTESINKQKLGNLIGSSMAANHRSY